MRSKAPLALMEQSVMTLVFALAAALCLRAFVFSDQTSHKIEARDRASVEAQSIAELIKFEGEGGGSAADVLAAVAERTGGTLSDGGMSLDYNEKWEIVKDGGRYRLEAEKMGSDVRGLMLVSVTVTDTEAEDALFKLSVAWQTDLKEAG